MQDSLLKQCTKCGELKSADCFNKRSACKDGLRSQCKDCDKVDKQRWDTENKAHVLKYRKQYRKINKNKENEYNKQYYQNHAEKMKQYSKQYKQNNREKQYQSAQKYKEFYRILYGVNAVLKGKSKTSVVFNDLPYTAELLCKHLESLFTPEMNWSNYGSYWELDHIIPQNQFNLENVEEFKICWSLANLRPLTINNNRSRPKDGSDISEEIKNKILNQFIKKKDEVN